MERDRRRGIIIIVGGVIGAVILTILDPSFVWFGIDLPQVFVGLFYAYFISATTLALGYATELKYGRKVFSSLAGKVALALIAFALAFAFDWALSASQSIVNPVSKEIRFALGAGVMTLLMTLYKPRKKPEPEPLAMLQGGRRKKIEISTPEGKLHQELVVVRRLFQLTVFDISEEAKRLGWTLDPDGEGRQWYWSEAQHADHFIRVSPGFFVHNGKSQGPMDGGADVSDPDAWSTVLITVFEPAAKA